MDLSPGTPSGLVQPSQPIRPYRFQHTGYSNEHTRLCYLRRSDRLIAGSGETGRRLEIREATNIHTNSHKPLVHLIHVLLGMQFRGKAIPGANNLSIEMYIEA